MAQGPPSQRYGTPSGRFWGNVVLIALAHAALIAGLIRWSVAAKASSNPESIVWLGGAADLWPDESEKEESPSPKQPPTATVSNRLEEDEAADEKPVVTTAKSEIELPLATPKPTATATPALKRTLTPAPKPKVTPKPIPKPTPKKTLVAKASPRPEAHPKASPAKPNAKSEKKDKITLAKKDSAPHSGSGETESTGKPGGASGLPAVASAKAGRAGRTKTTKRTARASHKTLRLPHPSARKPGAKRSAGRRKPSLRRRAAARSQAASNLEIFL